MGRSPPGRGWIMGSESMHAQISEQQTPRGDDGGGEPSPREPGLPLPDPAAGTEIWKGRRFRTLPLLATKALVCGICAEEPVNLLPRSRHRRCPALLPHHPPAPLNTNRMGGHTPAVPYCLRFHFSFNFFLHAKYCTRR